MEYTTAQAKNSKLGRYLLKVLDRTTYNEHGRE